MYPDMRGQAMKLHAMKILCVVAGLLLCRAAPGAQGVRRICSFERMEAKAWGWKLSVDKPDKYTVHKFMTATTETATHGDWALRWRHHRKYDYLRPGNKTTYYIRSRSGTVLRTLRRFRTMMPADWSGADRFRLDVKTSGPPVRVRLELEDAFIPDPVVRTYRVPGGKWVTLEADLARAARERGLDLARMAVLTVMIVERIEGKQDFTVWLDNLRLLGPDADERGTVVADPSPMAPPVHKEGKVVELPPVSLETTASDGRTVGVIPFGGGGYTLMKVMERAIGGFGDGGVILVNGPAVYLSRDAGRTWTGLDGKPKPTRLSGDHRGRHRATATVLGTDILAAFCTRHCSGGGGRTRNHFTRAVRADGRWTFGPEIVMETGVRHCTDRFSIVRTPSGRIWCAWNHTARLNRTEIRAKFSDDGGETWLDAGLNALVAAGGCNGWAFEGPFLAPFGDEVICVWRRRQKATVFARARRVKVKIAAVAEDGRATLDAGADRGLRKYGAVLVEQDGKPAAVLALTSVSADAAVGECRSGRREAVAAGAEAVGFTWTKPEVISKKGRRASLATASDGTLYALIAGRNVKSVVLRYDGETWAEDTPPDLPSAGGPMPQLARCGDRIACVWNLRGKLSMSVRSEPGGWGKARLLAEEEEPVASLAVPQVAPKAFLPVAWSTRSRKFIKVVAVPLP
jgi:hypothetical protein